MSSLPNKSWSLQLRELATSPITIIAMTCILGYVVYVKTRRQHNTYDDEDYENEGHVKMTAPLHGLRLNRKELAAYNVHNKERTYLVALKNVIYDVSTSMDFGPGGKYACATGSELSPFIKKIAGWEGSDVASVMAEWQMKLEDFFDVAGLLTDWVPQPEEKKTPGVAKEKIGDSAEKRQAELFPDEKKSPLKASVLVGHEETNPEVPDLILKDVPTNEEANYSDCESLRTAYDYLPGQDEDNRNEDDEDEEFCDSLEDQREEGAAGDQDNRADAAANGDDATDNATDTGNAAGNATFNATDNATEDGDDNNFNKSFGEDSDTTIVPSNW